MVTGILWLVRLRAHGLYKSGLTICYEPGLMVTAGDSLGSVKSTWVKFRLYIIMVAQYYNILLCHHITIEGVSAKPC